jgi:hypothetical protein
VKIMVLKEEHLALSSGISLAGLAVSMFYEDSWTTNNALEEFKGEIFECIIKPDRTTAVHYYLGYLQDILEQIENKQEYDGNEEIYSFIKKTLIEVRLVPELKEPDFDDCPGDDEGFHEKCRCGKEFQEWIDYVEENAGKIDELIVHAAFQIVFRDKIFLHDFHLELSDFIEGYIEDIKEYYPDYVTSKNRISRKRFPEWLKDAVYHRDMGTCSNPKCRCDLTKKVRTLNNNNFDHIVPLNLFGSNDASNIQLMCETCNKEKGDRSTLTGAVNTPFWNMD